jgi:predicted RNA-binding Zn-ribbon protein involved in translation (DUF1610 family)
MKLSSLDGPLKIKETYIYDWTCPACNGSVQVRTDIVQLFLSCPICGIIHHRSKGSREWSLLTKYRTPILHGIEEVTR